MPRQRDCAAGVPSTSSTRHNRSVCFSPIRISCAIRDLADLSVRFSCAVKAYCLMTTSAPLAHAA